mgnify:CR=1 FL=1
MNAERMARELPGWTVRYYESVDSTNAAARAWLKSADPPPSSGIVVADEQTAGRGRFGRLIVFLRLCHRFARWIVAPAGAGRHTSPAADPGPPPVPRPESPSPAMRAPGLQAKTR